MEIFKTLPTSAENIILTKRKNSKGLTLSARGDGKLCVSMPVRLSYRDAEAFLRKNADRVNRYLDRVEEIKFRHKNLPKRDMPCSERDGIELITARLAQIARETGTTYNKIRVRELKTKWGSYSSSGNVSLNIKISRLPEELMDYVITHELVHTRVRGHGEGFWREMVRVMPEATALNRKLKAYSPEFL